MTRRCSHCSNNGHNSRTCPSRGGLKLFGVRLTDGSIKKSASMGNLSSVNYHSSSSSPNQGSPSSNHLRDPAPVAEGYASDDLAHASCSSTCRGDRKKGTPWTEDEHRLFLVGLQKLGKGDWRGIARNYVVSRTPTQVASHAQKYFIRQSNSTRRKRRSSLFDMIPDVSAEPLPVKEEQFLLRSPVHKAENMNSLPHLHLSLDCEPEPMESISNNSTLNEPQGRVSNTNIGACPLVPAAFYPAYIHVPLPIRPPNLTNPGEERMMSHQVLKPTPIHSKDPVNVDELVGMSNKLTLGDAASGRMEPSELSMKLLGVSSRPSAFHANPTLGGPEMSRNNDNVIHAV